MGNSLQHGALLHTGADLRRFHIHHNSRMDQDHTQPLASHGRLSSYSQHDTVQPQVGRPSG